MKAILINVETQEVNEVEIDGSLRSIYDVMGVQMIETATYLPNGDCIYVDEEGMLGLTEDSKFFDVGAHQPFAGNGLVIGTDRSTGENVSAVSTVEDIRAKVTFKSLLDIWALSAPQAWHG